MKAKHLIDSKGPSVKHIKLCLSHPGRVLTTILIFNNVVNILASSVTTQPTYTYFPGNAVGLATAITTILVLVFWGDCTKAFLLKLTRKACYFLHASYKLRFIT